MTGTTARTSCRPLFRELQILTLASQLHILPDEIPLIKLGNL